MPPATFFCTESAGPNGAVTTFASRLQTGWSRVIPCNSFVPFEPTYPASKRKSFANSHCTFALYCWMYGVRNFGSIKMPLIGTPTSGDKGESGDGIVGFTGNWPGCGTGMNGTDIVRRTPGSPTARARYG